MNTIQINKLSYLHNGESIFFCKTDFIYEEFEKIKKNKNKVILITGNSDYCITDEIASKVPKNIIKWFCQNRLSDNPILESIPLGIENTVPCKINGHGYVWDHAHEKDKMLQNLLLERQSHKNLCYANFDLNTNYTHRSIIKKYVLNLEHVTWNDANLSYQNFIQDIINHDSVICAQGNGPGDNHRIYETLYCGRVPITFNPVQYNFLHKLFPVLLIKDLQELNDRKEMERRIREIKNKINLLYLDCDYWINYITKYAQQHGLM